MKLLHDILVVDFSQFLSGPSASLRLADLGATVIKIEQPKTGDICRELYVSDVMLEGDSTIFHAINRNKQSYVANLKDPAELQKVKDLIKRADIVMHNFRPGVMQRLGLGYDVVRQLNPIIIYGEISGYGQLGPWSNLPGQDLLLQSVSGLAWLSNNQQDAPTPMGVAVVDILAGTHLAQGLLAALLGRGVHGQGALIQVSMLETALDFQFEVLTCYYNDGRQLPQRSSISSAHSYIAAPYGIYETAAGYIALAMTDIPTLGSLLQCEALQYFTQANFWFERRDEIKTILAQHLLSKTAVEWLEILEPADVWCAPVMDYDQLLQQEGYKALQMELTVKTSSGLQVKTTRCPIRFDGQILAPTLGAPTLGEHNKIIEQTYNLCEPTPVELCKV